MTLNRNLLVYHQRDKTHPVDEMLYVLDQAMTLDIVERDKVESVEVSAGMMCIVPPAPGIAFALPMARLC